MTRALVVVATVTGSGLVTGLAGCGTERGSRLAPTRGYILISLQGVGARHLESYGYERPTTPFFSQLATEGALFEKAFAQSPLPLASHVSLLTGLYPSEHDAIAPTRVFSPAIETLAERFSQYGFFTAAQTEGGFVSRHYGFHRGFDRFRDPWRQSDSDVRTTFSRALELLTELSGQERFFLFVHTIAAEPPYDPPNELAVGSSRQSAGLDSTPPRLRSVNAGFLTLAEEEIESLRARYDAALAHLDQELETLFAGLERLGLRQETTIVVTSDHGEEFGEHGKLSHVQLYPETIQVPLLVLHPELRQGKRISQIVESIDLAPTLYELADIPQPGGLAGRSFAAVLAGEPAVPSVAYAEVNGRPQQRTLIASDDSTTLQLVRTTYPSGRDGTWMTRSACFDTQTDQLSLELVSFHRPRWIDAWRRDEKVATFEAQTRWGSYPVPPSSNSAEPRVCLRTAGCESPLVLGLGPDPRCLSFKVRGRDLALVELFDLDRDPGAGNDLRTTPEGRAAAAALEERLRLIGPTPHARATELSAGPSTRELLTALGYLDAAR